MSTAKLFSLIIIGGIALLGAVYWVLSSPSAGLDMEFSAPEKIIVGVPFDLDINLINKSGDELRDIRIFLNLPDGLAIVGAPASKNTDFKELKTLRVGGLAQQTFKLIAVQDENSAKTVSARAAYLSESLSSRFEVKKDFDLSIGGAGMELNLTVPEKILGGEEFVSEISYKNASEADFSDLKLKIDYPLTFQFIKSSLRPDAGNNIWILGGLRKGSEMKFTVSGRLIGPESSSFELKAVIETNLMGQDYPIAGKTVSLVLGESPLSLKIKLDQGNDYIARSGEELNYNLEYANNTSQAVNNAVIKVQLIGSMFDVSSAVLTWDSISNPGLANLRPGDSGTISFKAKIKSDYPIKRLSDKNFLLKVSGRIESGPQIGLANLETKVAGQIQVDAKGYFRDAASGILNNGPLPPKVGQPTNFTIHWLLKNFASDIQNVEVRAKLADNVKFSGVVQGNGDSLPVYDESSNEMVWKISRIPATVGILSGPLEAIFQIEAKPAAGDAGKYMQIIYDTRVTAHDEFSGLDLAGIDAGINTVLPDDPTVGQSGIVIQ